MWTAFKLESIMADHPRSSVKYHKRVGRLWIDDTLYSVYEGLDVFDETIYYDLYNFGTRVNERF